MPATYWAFNKYLLLLLCLCSHCMLLLPACSSTPLTLWTPIHPSKQNTKFSCRVLFDSFGISTPHSVFPPYPGLTSIYPNIYHIEPAHLFAFRVLYNLPPMPQGQFDEWMNKISEIMIVGDFNLVGSLRINTIKDHITKKKLDLYFCTLS